MNKQLTVSMPVPMSKDSLNLVCEMVTGDNSQDRNQSPQKSLDSTSRLEQTSWQNFTLPVSYH